MKKISERKIGIGSFAFRYAIARRGKFPAGGMEPEDFILRAADLGYGGVQLCENLDYEDLPDERIEELGSLAASRGLFVELGMRNLTRERFFKHIRLAEKMKAGFLRVVIGDNRPLPETRPEETANEVIPLLREALPAISDTGITVGIENHFDVPNETILRIVREAAHPRLGIVMDTTNCLGFLKAPGETLEALGPHLLSLHVKDYEIRKAEGGYLVHGVLLGKGRADPAALIGRALSFNPGASIILEMSLRREEGMEGDELLAWEQRNVEENTKILFDIIARIPHES